MKDPERARRKGRPVIAIVIGVVVYLMALTMAFGLDPDARHLRSIGQEADSTVTAANPQAGENQQDQTTSSAPDATTSAGPTGSTSSGGASPRSAPAPSPGTTNPNVTTNPPPAASPNPVPAPSPAPDARTAPSPAGSHG